MENLHENETLLEKVGALIDKLTPITKDDVIKEFLSYKVYSAPDDVLEEIVGIIFEKAVETPRLCSLYVELCKREVESELQGTQGVSKFGNCFTSRASNALVRTIMDMENPGKFREHYIALDAKFRCEKFELFGIVTLMGQLYRYSIVPTQTVLHWLYNLIRDSHPVNGVPATPPYNEECLQSAIQLLMSVGQKLDVTPDFAQEYANQTVNHLIAISGNCSDKTRLMVQDLIKLRSNLRIGTNITQVHLTTLNEELRIAKKTLEDNVLDKERLSQQLEEAKQGWEQAEAEKAELSKQLEEANQGRHQAKAEKVKLCQKISAVLEDAAGAKSANCDTMQPEKDLLDNFALCGDSVDTVATKNPEFKPIYE